MFLNKMFCCKRLLKANVILNCKNIGFGSSASRLHCAKNEIIEKWKKNFTNENISEIESSLKHLMDHVIGKTVCNFYKKCFG